MWRPADDSQKWNQGVKGWKKFEVRLGKAAVASLQYGVMGTELHSSKKIVTPPPTIVSRQRALCYRVHSSSLSVNTRLYSCLYTAKISMKLVQIITMWMEMCEKVFKVMGQRSRSGSDGNLIAPEPLNKFEQKLVQILTVYSRETNWLGLQGDGFKGQGHKNVRRRKHNDRQFAAEDHLVESSTLEFETCELCFIL